jgi:raffinose/stachyose/melibiose transport system substrate-binding protein
MRKGKRVMSAVLAIAMLASFTACSGGNPTASSSNAPASAASETTAASSAVKQENVTLTFMASQDWVQDAEMKLGVEFEKQTGIKIDYQIIPSAQYSSLLMTKLNAGEGPDIFGNQSGRFDIQTQLNVEKNAVDLSSESWVGNVDKDAAAELSVNGKLYGQPMGDVSAVWAIAYNKNIFKSLGIEIPKTYSDFKAACAKIKAKGITPIYECVSDGWHHTLWFPEMGPAAETATPGLADNLNNNKAKMADNQTMQTVLSQIKEMATLGYWGDNYMSNKYADTPKNFATGKYAMTVANQGLGADINKVDPKFKVDDVGYFVIPLADNQTLNVNPCGPSRFIYKNSKNVDAAKKYLEFMASDSSLKYLTENVSKFNKLPYSNAPSKYSDTIKEFYARYPKTGTVYQTAVKYLNPQWTEMGSDISALLLGEEKPNEVLKNIDKRRAEQAKTAKDPAWN